MPLSALTPQSSRYTATAMAGAITVAEVITMDGAITTIVNIHKENLLQSGGFFF